MQAIGSNPATRTPGHGPHLRRRLQALGAASLLSLALAACDAQGPTGAACVQVTSGAKGYVKPATKGHVKPNRTLNFFGSVDGSGGRNRVGYLYGRGEDYAFGRKIKKADSFTVDETLTCKNAKHIVLKVGAVPRDKSGKPFADSLDGYITKEGATTVG